MAKSKRGGSAPPKSKSEDSVRSKIVSIEGGLGALTASLQSQNNNTISLIEISNSILEVAHTYLRPMEDNIRVMAQAMLGMDVTDAKGNKVVTSGMKVQGSGLETAAENKKRDDKRDAQEEEQTEAQKKQAKLLEEIHKDLRKGSILDILIGAAVGLAGFVTGVVGEYVKIFSKILKPVINFFKGEGVVLEKVLGVFKGGWAKFVEVFVKLKTMFMENSFIAKVVDLARAGWTKFTGYLSSIGDLFKTVSELWAKLFGAGEGGGFLSKIFGYFKAVGERLGWFFKLGKTLGSIIGKIMIPIQVIMSIFDTVSGALDGWENTEGGFLDKLIGAIKGGLTGLLNGLIGGLLDLLKDGVSWLLEMMGFENASKALDSFSFQDVIKSAVDGIVDFFMTPVRMIQEMVKAFKGEISWGDMFKNMLAQMISGFLAPFSGLSKLVGVDIKQKVLDLLGLPDPKGGGAVQATGETGVATKALEKTTGENTQVKDQAAAATAAAASAISSNSSSKVVNNNTTQAAIIKTKTTNWDPEDQWARGLAYGA